MDPDDFKAIVGICLGVIGTSTGLWSLWLHRRSHRVHIKLKTNVYASDNHDYCDGVQYDDAPALRDILITVTNKSYFPVTVTEAGIVVRDGWLSSKYLPFDWCLDTQSRNPESKHRIESRDNIELKFNFGLADLRSELRSQYLLVKLFLDDLYPDKSRCKQVYVVLATGDRFFGTKKEFKIALANMNDLYEHWLLTPSKNMQD